MVEVVDHGRRIAFDFEAVLDYHGPGSPGGAAQAYAVLGRALPLLDPENPCERRDLEVRTAFGGPGARDAIELVTRAVTDGRYVVDAALARPALGPDRERFVFRLAYRGRTVTLVLRDGFIPDGFFAAHGPALDALKLEMAVRVLAVPPEAVYDAER